MKKTLKRWSGELLFRSGTYRQQFRGRAVIVTFHRVRDDLPGNPITCTVAEFRAYCDFFSRYFDVIPVSELLARLRDGRSLERCLAITFDDGYSDNARVAARELAQRGLPACFFIATNLIGSTTVPWWDAEWRAPSEWMSWNEVRALRAAGFEIGGHTCNHVDLGKVSGVEARAEIVGCKVRLERELDEPVHLFSYPYGRFDQMTDANRLLVREAGFSCCFSAYGGSVRPGDDPYHLKRFAVSPWFASAAQLGYELAQETV